MPLNKKENSEVYEPSDDSFLMSETLKKEIPKFLKDKENINALEVGCGEGIQLQTLYKTGIKKQNILSCDINPKAVEECKKQGFNSVVSDLFSGIKSKEKFNIIVFNPPYLPEENSKEPEDSKIITTGGKKGGEVINRFLKQSKKHLKEKGIIFLLTSSLTKNIIWQGLNKELVNKKSLFFEKLYVWKLYLNN